MSSGPTDDYFAFAIAKFQQIRTRNLGPVVWVESGSDRGATSAQFLKAFEYENFVSISLWRGLVILQVFAVTARAFEPN